MDNEQISIFENENAETLDAAKTGELNVVRLDFIEGFSTTQKRENNLSGEHLDNCITKLKQIERMKEINDFSFKRPLKLLTALGFSRVDTEQVTFYKDEMGNNIYFEGGQFELLI